MRRPTLLLAVSTLPLLWGCSDSESATQSKNEVSATIVKAATVERTRFDEELNLTGTIEANQLATLVPDVPGRIRSVEVRIGQSVKQGEVLLTLVDDDYAQGVFQAEAAADMARAQLSIAEATHRRFVELKARDAVTPAEFEQVEVGFTLAQAQLRQADVGFNIANARWADTRLVAPFDGTVVARNVEAGEMLGAMAQRPPIQLADLSQLRVTASVGELQARKVKAGDVVAITVDALPAETFSGRIQQVNRWVDPRTRTVAVEAVLDQADDRLMHGMTAGLVLKGVADESLSVPREALLDRDDGSARVLVVEGGTVASREIHYGRSRTGLVPILDGLQKGEQVLIAGHTRLDDGSLIQIADGAL